jgi:hypothetical protein
MAVGKLEAFLKNNLKRCYLFFPHENMGKDAVGGQV